MSTTTAGRTHIIPAASTEPKTSDPQMSNTTNMDFVFALHSGITCTQMMPSFHSSSLNQFSCSSWPTLPAS